MAAFKKVGYKYCVVPMCKSTTVKNPNKFFFHVPNDMTKRKKWCKLMRRHSIGPKSTTYVCEDHFDVENDTENLFKYRLVGGTLKLKANICPHKFDCQKAVKPVKPKIERGAYEKRRRIEFFENLLTQEVPSTSSQSSSFQSFELIKCEQMELNETEDPLPNDIIFTESVTDNQANKKRDKQVQVNIKISHKHKAVQTTIKRNSATDTGNKCTENVHEFPHSFQTRKSISSLSSSPSN